MINYWATFLTQPGFEPAVMKRDYHFFFGVWLCCYVLVVRMYDRSNLEWPAISYESLWTIWTFSIPCKAEYSGTVAGNERCWRRWRVNGLHTKAQVTGRTKHVLGSNRLGPGLLWARRIWPGHRILHEVSWAAWQWISSNGRWAVNTPYALRLSSCIVFKSNIADEYCLKPWRWSWYPEIKIPTMYRLSAVYFRPLTLHCVLYWIVIRMS